MTCERCGYEDIGEIRFASMAKGVTFHFCRRCEYRWWVSDAGDLELGSVLEAATVFARAS
jgi:hypothetical protein